MRRSTRLCGIAGAVATSLLLCACASGPTDDEPEEVALEFEKKGCFRPGQVTGFEPLDRQNMIVYAPTKSSAYHVRINRAARELTSTNTIAFDSAGSMVCGYPGEGVLLGSGGMARRYFVTDVYELNAEGVQMLIEQFSVQDIIEPQNNSGAEIERDIEPEKADQGN